MKYYFVESNIKDGNSDYEDNFIISSETEAPPHAHQEISVMWWSPYKELDRKSWDGCVRFSHLEWHPSAHGMTYENHLEVTYKPLTEIPASEIEIVSKYLKTPKPFVFNKNFDPNEDWSDFDPNEDWSDEE